MKFSIVIPCYNEEGNVTRLVKRFNEVKGNRDIELILVDNGSNDFTQSEILKEIKNNDFVKLVIVEENQGYGFGILAGLKEATGEYLGWLHADLQTDPKVIMKMINYIYKSEEKKLFFKGLRKKNRTFMDWTFTFGMSIFETIYLRQRMWDINAQPTLFPKEFYEKWVTPPTDFSLDLYAFYIARREGYRVVRVPAIQSKRVEGKSSWNTGFASRIKQTKRTLCYSNRLKKQNI